MLWQILRLKLRRHQYGFQSDQVLFAVRTLKAQKPGDQLLRIVQRNQTFLQEHFIAHFEGDSPRFTGLDRTVRLNIELTDEFARTGQRYLLFGAIDECSHRHDVLFERDRTCAVVLHFEIDQQGIGLLVERRSFGMYGDEAAPRGNLVRREAHGLLRQAHRVFRRHVNPPDNEHQNRDAGQQIHPHMIARRNESDVRGRVVDRQWQCHGETRNGALGHSPVQHPDDADQKSGERPPPRKRPAEMFEVNGLAVEQRDIQLERLCAGVNSYPLAGTEQGAGALNSYSGMDMPVTRIARQHYHFELVDSALINEY